MALGAMESPHRRIMHRNSEKSKVRRCLFGAPDPSDTSVKDMLAEVLEADRQKLSNKYNLNEESGDLAVADGRFEWDITSDVPDFYKRAVHSRPTKKCVSRLGLEAIDMSGVRFGVCDRLSPQPDAENSENIECVGNRNSASARSSPVMSRRQNSSFRQSHMNDFLQQRKRRNSDLENQRPSKAPRE